MSKPLATKHCRNPLGHGVHQNFTGCHWNPLPLLHDDITELVDVRDLALLHLPFEDAPQMLNTCQCITFTLSFFSKAVMALEHSTVSSESERRRCQEVWLYMLLEISSTPIKTRTSINFLSNLSNGSSSVGSDNTGVTTANHLSPPIPIFCILNTRTH
ncbi:hypothetical protein QTP86_000134 [Hemibagrus guttatus]|nr:hypothetical protein QTP86_000134 [Hemibagrus guttatus]